MNYWKIPVLAVLIILGANELRASDTSSMIRKGVELHDAGDHQAAIQLFKSVLELEPTNTQALYELANSYLAIGAFDSCIKAAKSGLKYPSALDAGFYMAAGSCYSSSEKTKKALKSFRSGLELAPDNANLNFNIAVTLFNAGDRESALEHLQTAVSNEPSYSSPYYFLGEIYRQEGARVQSLYYFARFFTLEPNTTRSAYAATNALGLLSSGIEMKSKGDIEVTVPNLEDDNPISGLEMSLSLAGLSMHSEDVTALPSEAHRKVSALTTFFQITLEMSELDDHDLRGTVVWKQAIAPLLRIHKGESSEALGFVMALRAGVEGAEAWFEGNQESLEKLNGLLSDGGPF